METGKPDGGREGYWKGGREAISGGKAGWREYITGGGGGRKRGG